MTFSIGIFASRFLIGSQVKENMPVSFEENNGVSKVTVVTKPCATNFTTTTMDGKNRQKVILKTLDGNLFNPCQK